MTGYVTPTTWEQCARHVEAGGIVEVQTAWGAWEREYLTPRTYRRRHGAPGGSAWVTRRLVPIECHDCTDPHTCPPCQRKAGRITDDKPGELTNAFPAAYDGGCAGCVLPVHVGQMIRLDRETRRVFHAEGCAP